jgi:hypothetical protein
MPDRETLIADFLLKHPSQQPFFRTAFYLVTASYG